MPRRRPAKAKRRPIRRRRVSRKKKANPRTCINRGPTYLPDRYMTKLVINDRRSISCVTGAANYLQYGLNCLYDPYLSVGGGQPNGFDQLISLYASYRVTAAKYTTYGTTTGAGAGANSIEFAAAPTSDSTLSVADPQEVASQPYGKLTFQYPGAPPRYISRYMPMARIFGLSRQAFTLSTDYDGTISANPAAVAYLTICAQSVDEASTSQVHIYTKIVFYCIFSDRRTKDDA